MVNGDTVQWAPRAWIAYHHLLFDRHEIIFAEGAAVESLHPGKEAMGALSAASRAEILALFPDLAGRGGALRATARPVLKRHEAMLLCRAA